MTIDEAYRILNSTKNSSFEFIKNQYHELAKKYHPDLNSSTGSTEKMQEINLAWQTILENLSEEDNEIKNSDPVDDDDSHDEEDSSYSNYQNVAWYTVRMTLETGLRIPKFCPITMSHDCSAHKNITLRAVKFEGYGRRVIMHSSEFKVPFSIKDSSYSSLLRKYVKAYYEGDFVEFRFKNREYAEIFAAVNHTTCIEETKTDVAKNAAKRAASSLGNSMGAYIVPLIIVFIGLMAVVCSN